ncbi:MAG: nitroreductase family protein [Phycisphaerae bacterium]
MNYPDIDFFTVVKARRSVREYLPKPVPREVLAKIVAAGVEAPSGANGQFRQYIIVDEPAVMDKIRPVSKALTGAPACIVLVVTPKATQWGEFWVQDASAAMENMLLAAVALGYGGCWVEGAVRRAEADLRKVLGVPEDLRIWSLTPIGKPAAMPPRPAKPAAPDVTHYNRYGGR